MKKGFTLIELAIVVVVLGILITGIVGGRSIIKTAKMNATVSQIQSYKTALNAFKLEFDAIPGDFDEADEYQITTNDVGEYVSCRNRNGNGNGHLEDDSYGGGMRHQSEFFNFWTYLYGAGLINDISTKFEETDSCYGLGTIEAGTHYPRSRGVGETITGVTEYGDVMLVLGGFNSVKSTNWVGFGAIKNYLLTTREAKRFDQKIDDGKPHKGRVKSILGFDVDKEIGEKTRGKFEYNSGYRADGRGCAHDYEYNLTDGNLIGCTLAIETDI